MLIYLSDDGHVLLLPKIGVELCFMARIWNQALGRET